MDATRSIDLTLKALEELLLMGADAEVIHEAASHLAAVEAALMSLPTDLLATAAWAARPSVAV